MIPFQRLTLAEQNDIVRACSYLFSPEQAKNTRFIRGLKPEIVKNAFRKKAKQYHPELHPLETVQNSALQIFLFQIKSD